MPCCTNGPAPVPVATARGVIRRSWFQRLLAAVEWVIPIATLVLIPKCPACFAAYLLLFTGIGLSFSTATALRYTLVTLSIAALIYLLLRAVRRAI